MEKGPDYFAFVSKEYELILNSGLKTLLFNGVEDGICDFMGEEKTISTLPWFGNEHWNRIKEFTKGPFGYFKEYANLKYVRVAGAGHFVPRDQPKIARDLLYEFMGLETE